MADQQAFTPPFFGLVQREAAMVGLVRVFHFWES